MLVIPIYNILVLPNSEVYLPIDSIKNFKLKDDISNLVGEKVIFVIAKNKDNGSPKASDFYKLGVAGIIEEVNQNNYILIKTTKRLHIDKIKLTKTNIEVYATEKPESYDITEEEEKVKLKKVKSELISYYSNFNWGIFAQSYFLNYETHSELLCAIAPFIKINSEEKYDLLKENKMSKRNAKIERLIYEYLEIIQVSAEAKKAGERDNQKAYREMAIKKQIGFLQDELDKMHPENKSDVAKFEELIKQSGMNEEALKEANKVLNRLKQENKNNPEYSVLYDYLDFVTSLCWKKSKFKEIDINKAQKVLDEDHYGLKKVKNRILEQIAIMNLNKKESGSILLFVGPPGTGKTSIASSVAKALDRKYVRVSLGGVKDEAEIRGHRRTYVGAMPGRIIDAIEKSGTSNPVMVLDEIDKLSSSYNGDPESALLEVLDPEQNNTFQDHYLNMPYDLSDVLFICTANNISSIPEALLNRMEIIEFNGYTDVEKFKIAKKYLIPQISESVNLSKEVKITDAGIKTLIEKYTFESGVRSLKRLIESLYRKTALKIVKEGITKLDLNNKNIKDFIDVREIPHESMLKNKKSGVVTGLAWTSAGGEILFIESLFTKGNGQMLMTGSIGDVMKESCQIAYSLVKSIYKDKYEMFEKNNLHVHVPAGSIPKDGPSAGITLVTSLASLVTNKHVSPYIAMTGEVSLRGEVMPIGGLPEKLMAAKRAKIKEVFIPKGNVSDLKDVPSEIIKALKITPVENVNEVLEKLKLL